MNTGHPRDSGWLWAYRKIRSLHCPHSTAFYRASLYALRGDTGRFTSHYNGMRARLRK
ncbi:MAG: hypothetical protein ABI114_09245 [Rhodanobacter sp.]